MVLVPLASVKTGSCGHDNAAARDDRIIIVAAKQPTSTRLSPYVREKGFIGVTISQFPSKAK
jgi:hypothetical protein